MGVDAQMLLKISPPLPARRVQRLGYEIVSAFGTDALAVRPIGDRYYPEGQRPLTIVEGPWRQDGPDILPAPNQQLVDVGLRTRYYGVGYERGDLPLLIGLARWFEMRIPREDGVPSVEVWYGGDCSGICAIRFDEEQRRVLFRHFVLLGHTPYVEGFDTISTRSERRVTRRCDLCDEPMTRSLWGGGDMVAGFVCLGCGLRERTRDRGATWAPWPEREGGA